MLTYESVPNIVNRLPTLVPNAPASSWLYSFSDGENEVDLCQELGESYLLIACFTFLSSDLKTVLYFFLFDYNVKKAICKMLILHKVLSLIFSS